VAQILFRSDTRATEFQRLTAIDAELDALILELVYLGCLGFEYGSTAGMIYLYEYSAEIETISYQNPYDIVALLKNIPKKTADFFLNRTIFYQQEVAKREAEAEKIKAEAEKTRAQAEKTRAEAEEKNQSAMEKKLKNLDRGFALRTKMIKGGFDPEEASELVGGLLLDQRAKLLLIGHDKSE
jgi:hypothetical protein